MQNIRIDYYTGTGGTELTVKLLANKLKDNNFHVDVNKIYRDNIKDVESLETDYYILVFPVHSFNAPKPIYEWVNHLFGNQCKAAVISVSGGGNVISNSACRCKTVKLLKNSNFDVIYEDMIRMPNNWMKVPNKKKYTQILSKLPDQIDKIAKTVLSEKRSKEMIYWIDYLVSELGEAEKKGTHKFGSGIKLLEMCIACGLCAKNCCSSNISMEPKPKFGNRCDMCLGCVYNCPQKALKPTYAAFQIDKKGYDLWKMCENAGVDFASR